MILPLILVQAVPEAPPTPKLDPLYQACVDLVVSTPQLAVERANKWGAEGGGWMATSCLGLAYTQLGRWDPAARAFEQAAMGAENAGHKKEAAMSWVQAGNAMLAGNNGERALSYFDRAAASGEIKGAALGQLHMDRARAAVMKGDLPLARAALDKATELSPNDPLAWLLSATLARRMNDVARAKADIEKAMDISPDDASVMLEAGNIALIAGYPLDAQEAWRRAIIAQPNSPAAAQARKALAENGMGVPVEKPAPAKVAEPEGR